MGNSHRRVRRNGAVGVTGGNGVNAAYCGCAVSLDKLPGTSKSEEIHHMDAGYVLYLVMARHHRNPLSKANV